MYPIKRLSCILTLLALPTAAQGLTLHSRICVYVTAPFLATVDVGRGDGSNEWIGDQTGGDLAGAAGYAFGPIVVEPRPFDSATTGARYWYDGDKKELAPARRFLTRGPCPDDAVPLLPTHTADDAPLPTIHQLNGVWPTHDTVNYAHATHTIRCNHSDHSEELLISYHALAVTRHGNDEPEDFALSSLRVNTGLASASCTTKDMGLEYDGSVSILNLIQTYTLWLGFEGKPFTIDENLYGFLELQALSEVGDAYERTHVGHNHITNKPIDIDGNNDRIVKIFHDGNRTKYVNLKEQLYPGDHIGVSGSVYAEKKSWGTNQDYRVHIVGRTPNSNRDHDVIVRMAEIDTEGVGYSFGHSGNNTGQNQTDEILDLLLKITRQGPKGKVLTGTDLMLTIAGSLEEVRTSRNSNTRSRSEKDKKDKKDQGDNPSQAAGLLEKSDCKSEINDSKYDSYKTAYTNNSDAFQQCNNQDAKADYDKNVKYLTRYCAKGTSVSFTKINKRIKNMEKCDY